LDKGVSFFFWRDTSQKHMTTLWSGRTCYVKYQDIKERDIFVPQGYDVEDTSPYAWRLKQDHASGKFFFVNLGGLSKRWRLPDIHDDSFMQELLQWSHDHKVDPALQRQIASDVSRLTSRMSSQPPGGSSSTPTRTMSVQGASPVLFVASPSPYFPPASRLGGGGTPPQQQQQVNAFVYDDAEWKAVDERHRRAKAMQDKDDAMRTEREREMEDMHRGVGPAGRSYDDPRTRRGDDAAQHHVANHPNRTPYDEFVDYGDTGRQSAVQYELARRGAERDERQRALREELAALEAEERLLTLETQREERQIRSMEEQQLDALRRGTSARAADRSSDDAVVYGAARAAAVHDAETTTPSARREGGPQAPYRPALERRTALSPSAHDSPPHAATTKIRDPYDANSSDLLQPDAASTSSQVRHLSSVIETLQKMLDHERDRNAKLQQQLDDKERIALEQLAAEAEREQREIAMRIRMLEAIAAHRRETYLLEEEKKNAEDESVETLRAQLTRHAQQYVPDHPLEDLDGESPF
jgi:predicted DNA binding CopG/RHH family protein